jgi:hypothetical protein
MDKATLAISLPGRMLISNTSSECTRWLNRDYQDLTTGGTLSRSLVACVTATRWPPRDDDVARNGWRTNAIRSYRNRTASRSGADT